MGGNSIKKRNTVVMRRKMRVVRRAIARSQIKRSAIIACSGLLLFTMLYTMTHKPRIDPAAYAPLLHTIAAGESRGNYNAYFGNANNARLRFTYMSVAEVMQWQAEYVSQGSVSSAVGKYQIIRPTLAGLVEELHIEESRMFDQALQDELAVALLERRGALAFAERKLSREQFAANLAKEWAALPKVTGPNPEQSYYASDGVNKSQISVDQILGAVDSLHTML